jgi:hypothetical protein
MTHQWALVLRLKMLGKREKTGLEAHLRACAKRDPGSVRIVNGTWGTTYVLAYRPKGLDTVHVYFQVRGAVPLPAGWWEKEGLDNFIAAMQEARKGLDHET